MTRQVMSFLLLAVALVLFAMGADSVSRSSSDMPEEIEHLGEFTFVLGEDRESVLEELAGKFYLQESPPDFSPSGSRSYTVHEQKETYGRRKLIGYFIFREDKLTGVARNDASYRSADAGTVVEDIVKSLNEMSEQTKGPI